MNLHLAVLSYCILSCSVVIITCESNDGKCVSLVDGPFDICTKAGYNNTLPFPKELTAELQTELAEFLTVIISPWKNCSPVELAAALECSFLFPKCNSQGRPVLPCRRVCGELLKQCYNQTVQTGPEYLEIFVNVILSECLTLPDEKPSTKKCFEPPNFTTNDSVKSPLDRGCQKLIFPACKNLGIYEHTLFSEPAQKKIYKYFYNKTYDDEDLETAFPKNVEKDLSKFSKCQTNIKKLYCGELFPPCFPDEGSPGLKTLCSSVCNDIVRDCPAYFRNHIMGVEYCSTLAEGNTSHGYCDRKEWPEPFLWLKYIESTVAPTEEPKTEGPKAWVIAVAVVVSLGVVGLGLAGIIWWKWRSRGLGMGYTKQQDDVTTVDQ
ncbi:uncharacterized protein LOC110040668 [Orbicella faveolata]|uniref:uncharacterized protein LOC110040668 n=1 Tax=Orbicella faveolata TaxID=48498 RepID=UPI0009E4300E|nr:uncharacterized protein LOC110040668 [Orbicella faveolata]